MKKLSSARQKGRFFAELLPIVVLLIFSPICLVTAAEDPADVVTQNNSASWENVGKEIGEAARAAEEAGKESWDSAKRVGSETWNKTSTEAKAGWREVKESSVEVWDDTKAGTKEGLESTKKESLSLWQKVKYTTKDWWKSLRGVKPVPEAD